MKTQELREFLESNGYTFNGVESYKKHDALYYSDPPQITYGRLQLTARVEDVPDQTWIDLFTRDTSEKRIKEET